MDDRIPKDTVDDMWRSVYGVLSVALSLVKQMESHASTKMKEGECDEIADCIAQARVLIMRYNRAAIIEKVVVPTSLTPAVAEQPSSLFEHPMPDDDPEPPKPDPVESVMELL